MTYDLISYTIIVVIFLGIMIPLIGFLRDSIKEKKRLEG